MMTQSAKIYSYSLKKLLDNFTVEQAVDDIYINGLTINSRDIKPGDLFVAVSGLTTHGRQFITQAINRGACAVLIDKAETTIDCAVPVIGVPDLKNYLSVIAGRFYQQPSSQIPVYGITGTNGKTTCAHLLAQCLAANDVSCGVVGTLGYGIIPASDSTANLQTENQSQSVENPAEVFIETGMTTADAISMQKICSELVKRRAEAIVMEVSSHGLAQYRVENIAINTAIFTNLSHDHLDYHGSMHAYGEAKARLFRMPSITHVVINQDDDFTDELIKLIKNNVRLATYSLADPSTKYDDACAHFSLSEATYTNRGVTAILHTPEGEFAVSTQLVGAFNMSNILAVISSLYLNSYPLSKIINCLPLLKSVPGRMELIANQEDMQVVVDFAHTPDALKSTLTALRFHQHHKVWCVFGCGGDRDVDKRSKMAAIVEQLAHYIIVTSDNPRTESPQNILSDIKQGFATEHWYIENRGDAITFAIESADAGDIILIAGKGHEEYQIIGSEKIAFSDRDQARIALRKRERKVGS
jgi:UDP-N-acetylmuramoyl-L-alanyl-D-glutamate--2,6-diaminopimelate ligase